MNMNKNKINLLRILLLVLTAVFAYFLFIKKNKEGFEDMDIGQGIEDEIIQKYMDESLNGLDGEELKKKVAGLRARLAKFGLYPSAGSPDLSKYVLKSSMRPEDDKCIVAVAEDRDKYIPKSAIPEPKCPGVDMSKYVLKSSIQPEKICPPPKDIDYSRYVLKSTIHPPVKCPPCICPKLKISAGLCKACPPAPKLKCPAPKPCPNVTCPDVKPCPPQEKSEKCHSIKYVKIPVVLKKTVQVNERGEILNETEEEVSDPKINNTTLNTDNNTNNTNNTKNNIGNNNSNKVPVAANQTQDEQDQQDQQDSTQQTLNQYYDQQQKGKILSTGTNDPNSELLNNGIGAYGKNNGLLAYNPTRKPLSDSISSGLNDQNNASKDDAGKGQTFLNELVEQDQNNTGVQANQLFNVNTQPKQSGTPHFNGSMERTSGPTLQNNMLVNQPQGQAAKCGPVKFNNVFRRYGVYGTQYQN